MLKWRLSKARLARPVKRPRPHSKLGDPDSEWRSLRLEVKFRYRPCVCFIFALYCAMCPSRATGWRRSPAGTRSTELHICRSPPSPRADVSRLTTQVMTSREVQTCRRGQSFLCREGRFRRSERYSTDVLHCFCAGSACNGIATCHEAKCRSFKSEYDGGIRHWEAGRAVHAV